MPKKIAQSKGQRFNYYLDPTNKRYGYFVAYRLPNGSIVAASAKICPTAKIGRNCIIHPHVKIGSNTRIGEQVTINSSATIGSNCGIGERVYIGARVKVGDGCHIEQAARVDEHTCLLENVSIGWGADIGNYTAIHAGAIVEDFMRIGSDAVIGTGVYVASPLTDGVTVDKGDFYLTISPVGGSDRLITAVCSHKTAELSWYVGCQHGIGTNTLKSRVKARYKHRIGGDTYRHAIAFAETHPRRLEIIRRIAEEKKRDAAAEKKRLAAEQRRHAKIEKVVRADTRARK